MAECTFQYIWSFGVVLYHLCSGVLSFEGAFKKAVVYANLGEDFPLLCQFAPNLPCGIQSVIGHMLQRSKEWHYQNAEEILKELKQFSAGTRVEVFSPRIQDVLVPASLG